MPDTREGRRKLNLPKVERRAKNPTRPTVHDAWQELDKNGKDFRKSESVRKVEALIEELRPALSTPETREKMVGILEDALAKFLHLKQELTAEVESDLNAHRMVDRAINTLEEQRNKTILPLLRVEPIDNPSNFMETNFDEVRNELIDDIGEEASWVDTLSHQEAWNLLQERKRTVNNTLPEQPEPEEVVENIPPNETPDQGLSRTRAAYLRILSNPPKEKGLTNSLTFGRQYRGELKDHAEKLEKAKAAYELLRNQAMERKIEEIKDKHKNDPEEQRKQALAYFMELRAKAKPEQGTVGRILSKTEKFLVENDVRDKEGNIDTKKTKYKRIAKAGLNSLMTLASTAALGVNHRTYGEGATRALLASGMAGIVTSESAQKLIRDKIEQFKKLSKLQKYAIVGAGAFVAGLVATQVAGISATSVAISGAGSAARYGLSKWKEHRLNRNEQYVKSLDIEKWSARYEELEQDLEDMALADRLVKWSNFVLGTTTSVVTAGLSARHELMRNDPSSSGQPSASQNEDGLKENGDQAKGGQTQTQIEQTQKDADALKRLEGTNQRLKEARQAGKWREEMQKIQEENDRKLAVQQQAQGDGKQNPTNTATKPAGAQPEKIPTPKTQEIAGMETKYVVPKGLGVTHAMKAQMTPEMAEKLKAQIKFEGDTDSPEFYEALGKHFGYIHEDGNQTDNIDEVRVKLEGSKSSKFSKAAYQFIEGKNGEYQLQESHLVGKKWIQIETKKEHGETFEPKTKDSIENPKYNNQETHDYEYYKHGHTAPTEKEPAPSTRTEPTELPKTEPDPLPSGPAKKPNLLPLADDDRDYGQATHQEALHREIVIERPAGNGTVSGGYVTDGHYLTRGPGRPLIAVEGFDFTPGDKAEIIKEMGAIGWRRGEVLSHIIKQMERQTHWGHKFLLEDTGLTAERAMNSDLNRIFNGAGSYLEGDAWRGVRGQEASEFIEKHARGTGDDAQLAQYLQNLERASGLNPKSNLFNHESVEKYIERAHARLAVQARSGDFDYRNLQVPKEVRGEGGAGSDVVENTRESIDFSKKDMYELWEKYTQDLGSLNKEERTFAAKIDKLRTALGSEGPRIRTNETAESYLKRLEQEAEKLKQAN